MAAVKLDALLIPQTTVREVQLFVDGCSEKTHADIESELTDCVTNILKVYSAGDGSILFWTDMQRYGLLLIKLSNVENVKNGGQELLEYEVFERALGDLKAKETEFDTLPDACQRALKHVHEGLYDALVCTKRAQYETFVEKLVDEPDASYLVDLLLKITRPGALDGKAFADRVILRIWKRLQLKDETFISTHLKRVPKIVDFVLAQQKEEPGSK